MAPERVAKRFRKLYRGRCARELARYTEADDLANARLRKVMTIYDRWPTLERVELYSTSLARVGIRDKTLGKQALVLKTSEDELAEALTELEDAVESLRQMYREGRAFVANEYGGSRPNVLGCASDGEDEDRTLTIPPSEYVEGLFTLFKMHERSLKLKVALYEEIRSSEDATEREDLLSYFVRPPCFDKKLVQNILSRAET